ncbi:MAG: WecB/TagA/CpsF family glycosyltransferase [Anaerolineae bacterium]|nr:WecB/TagA/CpsF family glycosyltransferase [Anaerolineae bacterium]
MIDHGKYNVLGVEINAIDYAAAVERIISAARTQQPLTVTALAVHGVMTGVLDKTHRYRLNRLDLVTPDGQPVRWALNWLHKTGLMDRVYGPTLTLKLCERVASENLPIYLYGSQPETLNQLAQNLTRQFPGLKIAGMQPSFFRQVTADEKLQIATKIQASGAKMVFVGLGCPRQETWVYEYRDLLSMPLLAVGAAFDFHAGTLSQAPAWMQKRGLEWFYRLTREPTRLWKRYLLLNPLYLWLLFLQVTRLRINDPADATAPTEEMRYG